jgi:hypothetical protein
MAQVSRPLWDQPLGREALRTPTPLSPPSDLALIALAEQVEERDPVWDSHRIAERDIFAAEERAALADLPKFVLSKKESDVSASKRAVQALAAFVVKWQAATAEQIRAHFASDLRKDDAALLPATALQLDSALAIFGAGDVPRSLRLRALLDVAFVHLRCSKEHFSRVERLLLALVSARPADASEVSAWLKGTTKVVVASGLALPVRAAKGF